LEVEALFNNLQAKLRVNNRPPFVPPTELSLRSIDDNWNGRPKMKQIDLFGFEVNLKDNKELNILLLDSGEKLLL